MECNVQNILLFELLYFITEKYGLISNKMCSNATHTLMNNQYHRFHHYHLRHRHTTKSSQSQHTIGKLFAALDH